MVTNLFRLQGLLKVVGNCLLLRFAKAYTTAAAAETWALWAFDANQKW